ncbi:MAG: hypothetical protein C0594_15380 [Marinilabiliales bacterium]|nr:MAG: hypothetical protein C0594_15380 [Marinilabiliales bacterium]
MDFFKCCKTKEEVRERYKRLAKIYHPDAAGDNETMQIINQQYQFCKDNPGKTYKDIEKESHETDNESYNVFGIKITDQDIDTAIDLINLFRRRK